MSEKRRDPRLSVDQGRRSLLVAAPALALGGLALSARSASPNSQITSQRASGPFWPGGARLAISVTFQFEADGGQTDVWQNGPLGTPQANQRFPNLNLFGVSERTYGAKEGIPRLLDMFDRLGIKGSSYMIGQTIDRYPDLAREIVARGHEAGGRQYQHRPQFQMPESEEREFLRAGFESYRRVLDQWPRGYNAWALQGSVNTDRLLQELGIKYTIDDLSRDEPWILKVGDDKELCVTPYMFHLNDLNFFKINARSVEDYGRTLRAEFETLYAEGTTRRRMMSVPLHDFVAGRPAFMPVVEEFLRWAAGHPGVWFARREEIADWVMNDGRSLTPHDVRYIPAPPYS